jgi:ubiquinone/menaquinone biosynthesis methyltransferase
MINNIKNKEDMNLNEDNSQKQVDFGFKKVNYKDKAKLVGDVFSSVANRYDIMNDAMSIGLHRLWKQKMIERIFNDKISKINNSSQKIMIADIAGGSADIALKITKNLTLNNYNHQIIVSDINQSMLDIGRKKAVQQNLFHHLDFVIGDGENLPLDSFPDNSFDIVTIAFGIRNFTNIDKGLSEFYRILKKGGYFICLEFSKVNDYFLQKIYNYYSFEIIPKMGKLIAKDSDSYQYLVESIRKFPNQDDFLKMIENQGFINCNFHNLTFGTVALHSAFK